MLGVLLFLLAETRLFDGKDSTVRYAYARQFAETHLDVRIRPERVLVISGRREERALAKRARERAGSRCAGPLRGT